MASANALFGIFNSSNLIALKAAMPAIASWVFLELKEGKWLVVAPAATTTMELSEKLGYSGEGQDTALIVRIDTYFGRNYSVV